MSNRSIWALVLCAAAGALSTASAAVVGPYAVDANTLHLWHLDESATPAADSANYSYTSGFTPLRNANTPLTALFGTGNGTASLGNAGTSGLNPNGTPYAFGTALSTRPTVLAGTTAYAANSVQPGLGALTPANGTADNVDHTFDSPTTHAFTMEALVQVGFDVNAAYNAPQEIIAGEGDAGDSSDRSWQFRIEAHPTATAGTGWTLRFQKVSGFANPDGSLPPGSSQSNYNLDGAIPSTGIDAIATGGWYHVAVTFNGDLNDTANIRLYWTKVDGNNTLASSIASGKMNGYLREQDTDFSIGNELRDFNGNTEPFAGQIDEVRMSDIARGPSAFIFVPEPATLAAFAGAGLVMSRRRRG